MEIRYRPKNIIKENFELNFRYNFENVFKVQNQKSAYFSCFKCKEIYI